MKVLPDDVVLVLKGHKVYSSVSLAALGIWSDGEFGNFLDDAVLLEITHLQTPALERLINFLGTVAWAPLLARALPPSNVKRAKRQAQTQIVSEAQRKIPLGSPFVR